ncbi:645_t:CDS:2 [Gigaspora margarita]|uniref:645_t:CDS:1 n=1 Tax=Gigaspora margarita TaxID=4874 RepID=A0ABN7V9J7_GIGMA|nr:645_t:CDS:2 [Gigaspora margarita]
MNSIEFELLETILYDPPAGFFLLDKHLSRIKKSSIYFSKNYGFVKTIATPKFNNLIETKLYQCVENLGKNVKQRVRLTINKDGIPTVSSSILQSLPSSSEPLKIVLDTKFTPSDNIFLYHKTTNRKIYDDARQRAHLDLIPGSNSEDGILDVLMYNERNEITECSIANIAVEFLDNNGKSFWKTPKIECGLLSGVMRSYLIESGDIIPGVITIEELKTAQQGRKVNCFNSVRKEYQVALVDRYHKLQHDQ